MVALRLRDAPALVLLTSIGSWESHGSSDAVQKMLD